MINILMVCTVCLGGFGPYNSNFYTSVGQGDRSIYDKTEQIHNPVVPFSGVSIASFLDSEAKTELNIDTIYNVSVSAQTSGQSCAGFNGSFFIIPHSNSFSVNMFHDSVSDFCSTALKIFDMSSVRTFGTPVVFQFESYEKNVRLNQTIPIKPDTVLQIAYFFYSANDDGYSETGNLTVVPEPSTLLLFVGTLCYASRNKVNKLSAIVRSTR